MTVRVKELSVHGSGNWKNDEVGIRKDNDGVSVRVNWACSENRIFNKAALTEAISNIDTVIKAATAAGGGVPIVLELRDSFTNRVCVGVHGDEVSFHDNVFSVSGPEAHRVPWASVKKALKQVVK